MSTDDNLEKTLMDLWVTDPHEVAYTIVVPEAKASIKAESLRIALEILPKKKEIPEIDGAEIVVGTGVARGYNQAIDDVIKAFEDRYGDTK